MFILFIWFDIQILMGEYWFTKRTSKELQKKIENITEQGGILGNVIGVADKLNKIWFLSILLDLMMDTGIYLFILIAIYQTF